MKSKLRSMENIGVMAIMVVFIIVVVIIAGPGKFFNLDNITSLVRSVAVVGIMACAVTLVMVTGNIDLSIGWMVGLAACICGVYCHNTVLGILLPVLVCGVCGALNGLLVGGLKLNAFITTLGTMYVFQGIAYLYVNGKTIVGTDGSGALKFLGQGSILQIPVPVWIFAVMALVFSFVLKRTTFGTKVYAVGANPTAARFSGVSPGKIVFLSYLLGGLATGLAGVILFTKVMATQVYAGSGYEFSVLTGIVLGGTSVTGGKGSVWGTALGVIFVGILSNGFTLMGLPSDAQYIAEGIILLFAIWTDVMRSKGVKG